MAKGGVSEPLSSLACSSTADSPGASRLRSMPAAATSRRSEGIMNKSRHVEITVTLTDVDAWQFAQFLKRACFSVTKATRRADRA